MRIPSGSEESRWDPWPLTRLLVTAVALGLVAHLRFGWCPDVTEVITMPRRVFEVFSFFALLSFGLAHIFLIVLIFPLYAVVRLNDSLYDLSQLVASALLGRRSAVVMKLIGLGGEILLFVAIALLIRRILLPILS